MVSIVAPKVSENGFRNLRTLYITRWPVDTGPCIPNSHGFGTKYSLAVENVSLRAYSDSATQCVRAISL